MKTWTTILLCGYFICVYSQMVKIQYTIKNIIVDPTFEETIMLSVQEGKPMIRAMEAAANKQRTFDFTAVYSGNLGYLITTLNGLESNYAKDKTYWEVFNRTDKDIDGVSIYIPSDGDIVTFNFTSG